MFDSNRWQAVTKAIKQSRDKLRRVERRHEDIWNTAMVIFCMMHPDAAPAVSYVIKRLSDNDLSALAISQILEQRHLKVQ